jgi:hypothetical protein
MSPIETFTNFLKDRAYAVEDLAELSEVIETVNEADGSQGYRLTQARTGDTVSPERIRHRCKMLLYYTWHSRDHVKKILISDGHSDAQNVGMLLNSYVRDSNDLQICSYLANEYKHAGVDDSQKWALEMAPRYGDIYVFGIMQSFPLRLKPTYMFTRKNSADFELTGFAEIDGQRFPFANFNWTVSCVIEDKNGNVLGDAVSICERGFQTWLRALRQCGVQIDFDEPMRASVDGILIALSKKQS